MKPPAADPQEIARTVATLFERDEVVELRIPRTDHAGTVSGYFSDHGKLAAAVAERNGAGPGVYVTLNPLKRPLLARAENRVKVRVRVTTSDADIERRRWLLIDGDPARPSEISSSDVEHEAAIGRVRLIREKLREAGWPEPVVADSGNGAHLLYRIDLPNDDDIRKLLENVLKAVAREFDDGTVTIDKTVFNAARIVKAYGTVAAKGDSTEERPHRLSRLLEIPAELKPVPRELLEALVAKAEPPKPPPRPDGTFNIEDFIAQHLKAREPVAHQGGRRWSIICPFNEEHIDAAVFEGPDGVLGFHCFHNSCSDKHWRDIRELFEGPRQHDRAAPPPPGAEEPQGSKQSQRDEAAFTFTSVQDLLSEPEETTEYVLDGILPTAGTSLLASKPKVGKSVLTRCLAVAVARGADFFGRATVQGPVLYIALEEKRGEVRRHFRLLGVTDEPIFVHIDKAPVQALAAAQRAIAAYQPRLAIIDPLQKFTRVKDTNDYAQVTAALEPVLMLARKSGAHLLCVHHAGKTDKSNPVDAALGSVGFGGGVDTIMIYKRNERYRTFQTTQKYGDDVPETVIEWDPARKAV
jgi:hypothetical protein